MNPAGDQERVRAGVEPDLFDLAEDYLQKRKSEMSLIPESLQNNDFLSIQRIGHQLRGNATLFGLEWLQEKGSELEAFARHQDRNSILELSKKMRDYLDRVDFFQAL